MERKQFKSRLFKRKIEPENVDYWYFVYAEVLFRMNEMDDYNCPCSFCRQERTDLKYILFKLVKDGTSSQTENQTSQATKIAEEDLIP